MTTILFGSICIVSIALLVGREIYDSNAARSTWSPSQIFNPHISHSYYRPSPAEDWPYTFYTMIHGRSEQECLDVVRDLAAAAPLGPYAVLRSLRELKKISMTYF